nr:zinc finger SWIM domain-containing protein 7 [Ipomoea batatas]
MGVTSSHRLLFPSPLVDGEDGGDSLPPSFSSTVVADRSGDLGSLGNSKEIREPLVFSGHSGGKTFGFLFVSATKLDHCSTGNNSSSGTSRRPSPPPNVVGESKKKEDYLCFPDHYCACYSFFYDVVNKGEQLCVRFLD